MAAQQVQSPIESKDDAIIRVTSFHMNRQDDGKFYHKFGKCRGAESLMEAARIIDTLPTPISSSLTPTVRVSRKDFISTLPVEMLVAIFKELGIRSTARLRFANRLCRHVIDNELPGFRHLVKVATPLLLAVRQTGLDECITVTQLYKAICTTACVICGKIGHYIYLLTVERCCLDCFYHQDVGPSTHRFDTVALDDFAIFSGLETEDIRKKVPVLMTLEDDPRHFEQTELINCEKAKAAVLKHGVGLHGDGNTDDLQRFEPPMVLLPFFNVKTHQVHKTMHCKGCVLMYNHAGQSWLTHRHLMNERQKPYFKADFLAHFQTCDMAQELWEASDGGKLDLTWMDTKYIQSGGLVTN